MRPYAEYLAMVESALPVQLNALGEIPEPFREAMLYSMEAGGKRLRPVLLLAACELLGKQAEDALPYACALEMIHTYSLIHDDLPAMDNDSIRRGKPSNHVVFGEATAILAGDGLLSAAFELMLKNASERENGRGVRAALAIARRCGVTGMVAGQVLDIQGEGHAPTAESVRAIHLRKTADLIIASVEAGFLLAGADNNQLTAGVDYARHLGMAFQMVDDLLDVTGEREKLGKGTGLDAASGKQTWVAVNGIEKTRSDARDEVDAACKSISVLSPEALWFTDLAQQTLHRIN